VIPQLKMIILKQQQREWKNKKEAETCSHTRKTKANLGTRVLIALIWWIVMNTPNTSKSLLSLIKKRQNKNLRSL